MTQIHLSGVNPLPVSARRVTALSRLASFVRSDNFILLLGALWLVAFLAVFTLGAGPAAVVWLLLAPGLVLVVLAGVSTLDVWGRM